MKKGKTITLNQYDTIKSFYGTVDAKELKSIYLNIQTWVTPVEDGENWNRVVSIMSREIKHSVLNSINNQIFKEHFIVDLDLRTSGIRYDKKSFMNLEINLYLIEPMDFKSPKLKKVVKNLIKEIYGDAFSKNKYFKFYLTKNGNVKPIKKQTETV